MERHLFDGFFVYCEQYDIHYQQTVELIILGRMQFLQLVKDSG